MACLALCGVPCTVPSAASVALNAKACVAAARPCSANDSLNGGTHFHHCTHCTHSSPWVQRSMIWCCLCHARARRNATPGTSLLSSLQSSTRQSSSGYWCSRWAQQAQVAQQAERVAAPRAAACSCGVCRERWLLERAAQCGCPLLAAAAAAACAAAGWGSLHARLQRHPHRQQREGDGHLARRSSPAARQQAQQQAS